MWENCGAWLENEAGDVDSLAWRDRGRGGGQDLGSHTGRKFTDCYRASGRGGLLTMSRRTCPDYR
jgi:hypothetical protein